MIRRRGSRKGRDHKNHQAILPLWGKMLNVEKRRLVRLRSNDKLTPMITAFSARGPVMICNLRKLVTARSS